MATTTCWITAEPTFGRRYNAHTCEMEETVTKVRVTGLTQNRPDSRRKVGTVTMKLTLEIPDNAFLPLRPEAVIVVPEDMVTANLPITVEATDPSEEEEV